VDIDHEFKNLEFSKKESDDRNRFLEKEIEDSKIFRVFIYANEDSDKIINDYKAREKTLRDKERDKLLGMTKNLKKESLKLEESNSLI